VFDPSIVEDVQAAGAETIIVDVDDIVSVQERMRLRKLGLPKRLPLLWADYWRLRDWERRLPQRFARVLVAKNEDRRFFPSRYHDRLAILPNGVRVPDSAGVPPHDSRTLLFVGTLHYEPNQDALRYFLDVVLPTIWQQRPDVRFQIVGHGPLDWLDERVARESRISLARSAPDVRPFYEQATLVVAPVRHGGGTRIKVLEALAYGRPLVSTTFAAEGCGLVDGTHVVYADDPASFAQRCVALLDAPAERARLGAGGREFVRRHYDWSSIEETVPRIVADARAATRRLG
jgi:glycosyltransferase involved in cell wall biosynthesis